MADDITAALPAPAKPQVSFGFNQISAKTPEWANWAFGGYYLLSQAFSNWLSALAANHLLSITPALLLLVTLTINLLLNPLVFGVSRMWGIQQPDDNSVK